MPQVEHIAPPTERAPLCVDLDGTLVRTDTLVEGIASILSRQPLALFRMMGWLFGGRASFKKRVAAEARFDAATLPYNRSLLQMLRQERAAGRRLVLATGADEKTARAIAAQLCLFHDVLASDGEVNLTGERKRDRMREVYGQYSYVGNSREDLAVWREADEAICVDCPSAYPDELRDRNIPVTELHQARPQWWRLAARTLRVHQWAKNLLLFVPVITAHVWRDPQAVLPAFIGMCAFHLLASAAYVLNDAIDLEADRKHPVKRLRPFAAGDLSPLTAFVLAPLLACAGSALALAVGWQFFETAAAYLAATVTYSLWLKKQELLDVLTLAGLYTWRVLAGSVAAGVTLSPWLLGFSIFTFLSLALVKRCTELKREGVEGNGGRGYRLADYPQLARFGTASGYVAVLIMALYVSSPDTVRLYPQPLYLWGICPVLIYWLSRIWLLTERGEMDGDPVLFALRDRASYGSVVAIAAFLLAATRAH